MYVKTRLMKVFTESDCSNLLFKDMVGITSPPRKFCGLLLFQSSCNQTSAVAAFCFHQLNIYTLIKLRARPLRTENGGPTTVHLLQVKFLNDQIHNPDINDLAESTTTLITPNVLLISGSLQKEG